MGEAGSGVKALTEALRLGQDAASAAVQPNVQADRQASLTDLQEVEFQRILALQRDRQNQRFVLRFLSRQEANGGASHHGQEPREP